MINKLITENKSQRRLATPHELLVGGSAQRCHCQAAVLPCLLRRGLLEGGEEPLPVAVVPVEAAVELPAGEAEEAAVLAVEEAEALLQLREDGLQPRAGARLAGERRDEEAGEAPDRVRDGVRAAPREVGQERREDPVLMREGRSYELKEVMASCVTIHILNTVLMSYNIILDLLAKYVKYASPL